MSTTPQVMNNDGIITEDAAKQEIVRLVTQRFTTLEEIGTRSHSVGFVTTADSVTREVFVRGAADKIVTDGERTLLLIRNTLPGIGKLAFFGGLQDKEEKIGGVAAREFTEESGLAAHFGKDIDAGEIFPITGDIRVLRPQPGKEVNFTKFAASIGDHGAKEGDLMVLGTKISMSLISPAEIDALVEQSKAQAAKLGKHSEGENQGNVVVKLADIVAGNHEMAFEHHVEIAKMAIAKLTELRQSPTHETQGEGLKADGGKQKAVGG